MKVNPQSHGAKVRRRGRVRQGEAPFEIVAPRLAVRRAEPPAVVVDPAGDVVRVVERRRAQLRLSADSADSG